MTTENKVTKFEESTPVTADMVKKYLCPTATAAEIFLFIEMCKKRKLNPWIKEAYLIKYGTQDATIIVAYEVFIKRANRQPDYRGYKAGLILKVGDSIERREGAFYEPSEKVLGAWCTVYREGRQDHVDEVAFHEYVGKKKDGTINKQWATKPGTMIRKVAISHAHRLSYPEAFSGMYTEDEMHGVNNFQGLGKNPMVNITPQDKPRITQEQADVLKARAEGIGMSEKLLSAVGAESFEEIPADKLQWLEEKLKGHLDRLNSAQQ